MKINSVITPDSIQHKQNFKGSFASSDELLNFSFYQTEPQKQEPNFFRKLLTHPSLIIVPLFPEGCYEVYSFFKGISIQKNIKNPLIKEAKLKEFNKTYLKTTLALFLAAIPLVFITDYINRKFKDKNFDKANKQIESFNKQNGTTLKLIPSSKKVSNTELASFDTLSAQVLLTEKVPGDLLYANIKQKHIINHELIHTKQHILMACSKDGINKINYIVVKRISKKLDDKKKSAILNAYQKIKEAKNDEYKTKTVKINNYKVNYVDYVTALYKVLYENESNPDNIPVILNKKFYEKAKISRGPLTQEEEKKAQAYLEAYEEYPKNIGFMQALNPNSDYHKNLLEKEASKAIPWYTNIIMNFLCFF